MATYLYATDTDFQTFAGGSANVSLELDTIAPTMLEAAHAHLIPWLSEPLWNDLVDAVANDDATSAEADLLPYVQRPLAYLTLYEYSRIGGMMMSEAGMFRIESEDRKSAYKYQENNYREYMLHHGYEALERMLTYLEENESDFSGWANSSAYTANKALLINTAADFRARYSKYISRYTFEMLRGIIQDVETMAIIPTLGQEQYDAIKEAILAKDLSEAEQALLPLLQQAVAHYAVQEAMVRHLVQLQGNRIIQQDQGIDQSTTAQRLPEGRLASWTSRRERDMADRYITRITAFLQDNLSDYPLYEAYLDAQAAAEASDTQEDDADSTDYTERKFLHDPEGLTVDGPVKGRKNSIVRF